MKKLTLVALIGTMAIVTACSKPVTEVKDGESKAPATTQQTAQLSSNNKADIKADVDTIQTFGLAQEQAASSLQQRMDQAMQKQDKEELKKLFTEFKGFVEKSNADLKKLSLKSTEGNQLREKMIENSHVGLEMSETILTSDMEKIDPAQFQPLQEKAMKAQQELMEISQDIHNKISDQPAASQQLPAPQQPAQ
ncbi:hypothetical protein GCM10023206_32020 [Acinetobacter puyangensis]|uniref:Lipoprotein n=1 Tax=Acinetobacter puyangensis TaxID=1096779 RepID=A0A240E371_9GAMM|nr:hypothetical protein [Acinetobacter puyangensis]SNX43032.1 hypothetical protein SAMN05421731_10166 [Acinetobacter puyangensis]